MKKFFKELSPSSLWLIFLLSVANSVMWELPYLKYAYYDAVIEAFNVNDVQLGFLLTAYTIGAVILYVPAGFIADRYPTKILILGSLFLNALLGFALAFFAKGFIALCVVYFLLAVSTVLLWWTAVIKTIRLIGGKAQASAYAFYYGIGTFVGVAIASGALAVYNHWGYEPALGLKYMITFVAIANIVTGVLIALCYKEKAPDAEVELAAAEEAEESKINFHQIKNVLTDKIFWAAILIMLGGYIFYAGQTFFTPYLTSRFKLTVSQSAAIAIIRDYGLYIFCPLGGYFADKVFKSTLKTWGMGYIIVAITYIMIICLTPLNINWILMISVILFSAGIVIILYGIMWAILSEININKAYAATAIGLASIFIYLPDMFIHPLYGYFIQAFGETLGYNIIFVLSIVLSVIVSAGSFILAKVAKERNSDNAELSQE